MLAHGLVPVQGAVVGGLVVMALCARAGAEPAGGPIPVEIRKTSDGFGLYRGGRPYYVKGAVYWSHPTGRFPLAELRERGGNSVRCGGRHKAAILDEAGRLGISVLLNLPVRMEAAHHFDYDDPKAVSEQFQRCRAEVLKHKHHPALLMWGIGNELSMNYKNRRVWNAVDDLARMIHQVDPHHPTLTVIGGGSLKRGDIREIHARCPHLDLLGINYYAGIEAVPRMVRQHGWDRPYLITEWGPSGHWQVPRTEWKAAIEETSTRKAQLCLERYQETIARDAELCLGSYAFIWSCRRERTHTWYGMFLPTGERTEAVNALQYLWTGQWPANRAPTVQPLSIDGRRAENNMYLEPGSQHTARTEIRDPDGDPVATSWEIRKEVARAGYAGMGERHEGPIPGLVQKVEGASATFAAPGTEGAYRIFVVARDGKGNAACANIPFYVTAGRGADR